MTDKPAPAPDLVALRDEYEMFCDYGCDPKSLWGWATRAAAALEAAQARAEAWRKDNMNLTDELCQAQARIAEETLKMHAEFMRAERNKERAEEAEKIRRNVEHAWWNAKEDIQSLRLGIRDILEIDYEDNQTMLDEIKAVYTDKEKAEAALRDCRNAYLAGMMSPELMDHINTLLGDRAIVGGDR